MNPLRRPVRLLPLVASVVILAGLLAAGGVHAADAPDVFTVANVPVDATAANAVAAREAARTDGERRALRMLLDRLTLASDQARLPRVSDQRLPDLVRDFEVANERSSGVRYLADYTFRFRPDAVRALLRNAGIPFTETVSKPVVVLPVFHSDAGTVLWDDPNPWRDAWASRKTPNGLVPLTVPLGDAEDVVAIDADRAEAADPAALAKIASRYDAGDALLAVATKDPSGQIQTNLRRVSPDGGSTDIASATFAPNQGESEADLMQRAVTASIAAVGDAWKRETMTDSSRQGTLTAQVPIGGLGDWISVRNGLGNIPAIKSMDVLALGRTSASVAIHYVGDPDRLRLALAQHDLALSGGEGAWTLQRQAAAQRGQ